MKEAIYDYHILDTPAEDVYDNVVSMASNIFGVPICAFSLIDSDRLWLKAKIGLEMAEVSRDTSFCAHTILEDSLVVVNDATKDHRFCHHPMVTGHPGIRFYAGYPIKSASGLTIATICIMDVTPRRLEREQLKTLELLGQLLSSMLELRLKNSVLFKATEFQRKVSAIVAKDIKSSLASIGTLINCLPQYVDNGDRNAQFTAVAIREFQKKYSLYCTFAEWCHAYSHDREDLLPVDLSTSFIKSLNKELQEKCLSKVKVFIGRDNINQIRCKDSVGLQFVVRTTILLLAASIGEGRIILNLVYFENKGATIEIIVQSDLPAPRINCIVRSVNEEEFWSEHPDVLLAYPEIAMVKDILDNLDGQIIAAINEFSQLRIRIKI